MTSWNCREPLLLLLQEPPQELLPLLQELELLHIESVQQVQYCLRLIRTDSSPSEISSSEIPDSSTNSISFLILRISIVSFSLSVN